MGVTPALIGAAVAIGTTAYASNQQSKLAHEQEAAQKAAMDANKPPALPDTMALAANMSQADRQAQSAGGTILSKPGQIGDGANTGRKSLLGQ